ncbi:MAG TPA: lysophospholipase [Stellaceae bacterium]|nr:lysophospholipase [Stellaceae bacterium]
MRARLRAIGLGLCLALGACAETLAPPSPSVLVTPNFSEGNFIAEDGTALSLRMWRPEGKVTAAILALHGFNDYSNAFAAAGKRWSEDGIAVYAYDQRGFGRSPVTGTWAGAPAMVRDVANASAIIRERHPGVPLYLLGESMGGAVVMAAVTGAAAAPLPDIDGIILVSPAVWGRETMTVFERAGLWLGDELFPGLTLSGNSLGIVASDNIDMLRGLGRDPLVIKGTRIDAIKGLVDLMDLALASAPLLTQKTLLLCGERDPIIPPESTHLMITRLNPASRSQRTIAWYKDGYHMLLRDLDAELVMRDVEAWIKDAAQPLPSGADRNGGAVLAISP